MIDVRLIKNKIIMPETLASFAGKMCYEATTPDIQNMKNLNVKDQLFGTGHHTTIEHDYFNFIIDGIAVSDVTFGLHLYSPFYNSDQRSGRYSSMYDKPDFDKIMAYINYFYKDIDDMGMDTYLEILEFIEYGYNVFNINLNKAIEVAKKMLSSRGRDDPEYVEKNAKKMAQEQLRNFISSIFETGLFYTIDISAMAAMYKNPQTPVMRYVFDKIKFEVISQFPELEYIFVRKDNIEYDNIEFRESDNIIAYNPSNQLLSIDYNGFIPPDLEDMIPIDSLYFNPKYMNNQMCYIKNNVKLSFAAMSQDQRHRTVKRGRPYFTGQFYANPIIHELGLEDEAEKMMNKWFSLRNRISNSLFKALTPYGAMLGYTKQADFNALAHEQIKRLCMTAQEEIYNLNRMLAEQTPVQVSDIFLPPCLKKCGKCFEGKRNCRRIIDPNNPLPSREI